MTNQQLTEFFNYAGLEFSNDPEDMRLLKKQLLLEMKSSDSDTLVIAGRPYSKNDLLSLFSESSVRAETVRNTEDLLDSFPLLKKVLAPNKVFLYIRFPDAAREHPDFDYFCQYEAQPRFQEFLQRLQTVLKEDKLEAAAGLLVLRELFTEEQRYKLESNTKIILRSKFAAMKAGPGYTDLMQMYFNNGYYYDIVRMVAANDTGFLFEQLDVAEDRNMRTEETLWLISMYTFQAQLPFSEDVLHHINTNLTELKNQHSILLAREIAGSSGSSRSSSFGIVWMALMLVLFVPRMCSRTEKDSSRGYINRQHTPAGSLRGDTLLIRALRDIAAAKAAENDTSALPTNKIQP